MTEQDKADIRRSYREAKHQYKQISILADLYLCSKGEIKYILGIGKANKRGRPVDMEKVKKALWMRDTGCTATETARKLGVSYATVKNRESEYA